MTVHKLKKTLKAVKEPKALVLDPSDAMTIARALIARSFTVDGLQTLHRHRGAFWIWTGSYYLLAEDEVITSEVWLLLEKALKPAGKGSLELFKPTRAKVGEVVAALMAASKLAHTIEPPSWLTKANEPPPKELFACGNGLLHLPTGKLYPPSPDYFNLNASEVNFDPNAPKPTLWLSFLDQLFGDDRQSIELLQELFGYTQSPDTSQQKIALLFGPRRCGKGTIARILGSLLGISAVCGPTMSSLAGEFGLEPLITKSLATVSDVRIGARTDKTTLTERLLSISGEDRITVPRKHRQAWTGFLKTRIVMLSNELPTLADGSGAYVGRLLALVFTVSFYGKEDPTLTDRLMTELPGILNWACEGYRRLRQRGYFVQPESSLKTIDEIELLGSTLKAFIRDCCKVKPGLEVSANQLWEEWRHWCEETGSRAGSKNWLGRNLRIAVPGIGEMRPRSEGAHRELTYTGIGIAERPM